jgi:hypothetical protein
MMAIAGVSMSDNTAILERVSKVLGVPQKELVRKGLEGLLQTQLRTCCAEINEIKTKYNVKSATELEKKFEKRHPLKSTLPGKI